MMKKLYILLFSTGFFFSLSSVAQNAEKLGNLLSQKEYSKVISLGLEELKNYPNNPNINMILGRAYADSKQFEKAIPYLEKGTTKENNSDWVQAWSYGYLGRCYYVTNDYEKSKNCITTCLKLNATENSTKYAKKLLEAYQMSDFYNSWEIVETENIRFHFQNPKNIQDIKQFIKNREIAYTEINKFFIAKPYKKIDFFIWDDPKQAAEKLGIELGFANPDVCIINSSNNQTRGHEITHILSTYGINPTNKTPLINEGIATYFDQTNRDRFKVAKESIAGKEINILDLWENSKNYPFELNYTIGSALVSYLSEKGTEDQLKRLLKDQTIASAKNIYPDFENLISSFTEKLKE